MLPEFQRQGIGSGMVWEEIEILRGQGMLFRAVLGHPEYYPVFGFEWASLRGIRSQWEGVPDEAFMVLILDQKIMAGVNGHRQFKRRIRRGHVDLPPGRSKDPS